MPPPLFLRPSRPSLPRRLSLGVALPLVLLFSFLTAPAPPTRSLALTSSPLLLSIRGPSPISPHRTFSSSPFFLGTRLRLPFVLVSHPLFHGRSVRSARCALRSSRERINECFTLSPAGRPVCFRARESVLPLSTMFSAHSVLHDPFLSLPSLLPASQFFAPTISLPYVFRSVPRSALASFLSAIPNLV